MTLATGLLELALVDGAYCSGVSHRHCDASGTVCFTFWN